MAGAQGDDGAAAGGSTPSGPDLVETLRQLGASGSAGANAARDAAKAFRTLLTADVSLARSALGRSVALTGVAIVFGASTWLLLMSALIVVLVRQGGLSWGAALLACALISGVVTGLAVWWAQRYFEHTRMKATRRQLARIGIGELADFTPDAGSPASTRQATEHAPTEGANGEPVKDERGVDVTPP